jgi:hypothetical protein
MHESTGQLPPEESAHDCDADIVAMCSASLGRLFPIGMTPSGFCSWHPLSRVYHISRCHIIRRISGRIGCLSKKGVGTAFDIRQRALIEGF